MTAELQTKGFLVSAMTKNIADEFIAFAEHKGRRSASVAQDLQRAAEELATGSLQFGASRLQSVLTSSWTQELAGMDAQYNLLTSLLYKSIFHDEMIGKDERTSFVQMVEEQALDAFEKARG
jgi:hypothetical protein